VVAGTLWKQHAPDPLGEHRSPLDFNGCCRVAHLSRRYGSPSQRISHRSHRWPGRDEVRRLEAIERRVREAVPGAANNMKKSGTTEGDAPSRLIDARIKELDDWRVK